MAVIVNILYGALLLGIYLLFCYMTLLATFAAIDEPVSSAWMILTALLWAALILFGGELGRILTLH